jgi:flagellar hook-associated protein 1 FlgK
MTDRLLGIAITGINASRMALTTASNNISNNNTVGYSRQETVQSSAAGQYNGSGFLGQGVEVSQVRRIYSDFLSSRVQTAQAQNSYYQGYTEQLSQIDTLLADPAAGLTPGLNDFFAGLQDLTARPFDAAPRQGIISGADALVNRFQTLNSKMNELRDAANDSIGRTVTTVNTYSQQLAELNNRISVSQNTGGSYTPPNDLLDQRDTLLTNLNKLVGVSVVKDDQQRINVYLGNGQALVLGERSFNLTSTTDLSDPKKTALGLVNQTGTIYLKADDLSGGTLTGYLKFRDESLETSQNALGRIAGGLAINYNMQHNTGVDLNGVAGSDFFNVQSLNTTISNINTSGSTYVPSVAIVDPSKAVPTNYSVTKTGATVTVTRASDGQVSTFNNLPTTAGNTAAVTVDGVSFRIDGSVSNASYTVATAGQLEMYRNAANSNTAEMHAFISDMSLVTTSSYRITTAQGGDLLVERNSDKVQFRISQSGATANQVTRVSDGAVLSTGFPPKIDGVAMYLDPATPTPATGDYFILQPTRQMAGQINTLTKDTNRVAAGSPILGNAASTNRGSGVISKLTVDAPPPSGQDYANPNNLNYAISFTSPTTFQVTGGVFGTTPINFNYTAGVPVNLQGVVSGATIDSGINFTLKGTMAAGDTFSISPNVKGVGNNENALALSDLQSKRILDFSGSPSQPGATLLDGYAKLVSNVGSTTREFQISGQGQQTLLDQTQAKLDSVSGVNLDEEAANLVKYQQTYQAVGRVISMSSDLFNEILTALRG